MDVLFGGVKVDVMSGMPMLKPKHNPWGIAGNFSHRPASASALSQASALSGVNARCFLRQVALVCAMSSLAASGALVSVLRAGAATPIGALPLCAKLESVWVDDTAT